MALNEIAADSQVEQRMAALISNAGAVRAVMESIQGTLGPKGLDCLLVDEQGGLVVTNDGVTILKTMDVSHPAARIIIGAAEHQDDLVGDGTTTATVIAGTLVNEGVNQALRGVPVIKIIDGIKLGISQALELLKSLVVAIPNLESPYILDIAKIAARNHPDLAELAVHGAREVGEKQLLDPAFKLADQVLAIEGAESKLISGTIIDRHPLNDDMPRSLGPAKILILDDALEPLPLDHEALGTEAGFQRWLQNANELRTCLAKLAALRIKAIFTDRSIDAESEEILTDYGIIGIQRVARKEWLRLAAVSGARPIKRTGLLKPDQELAKVAGEISRIEFDEVFQHYLIYPAKTRKLVTLLTGAHTREVVREKERIAKDAASAVQAALRGGIVAGGGSTEVALARKLKRVGPAGLLGYGFDCVIQALQQPLTQICANAGLNPLEKIVEVLARQEETGSNSIGVDCESGTVADLGAAGIWDPYEVKLHAIKSAGEVAEAILRIGLIIKMKELASS